MFHAINRNTYAGSLRKLGKPLHFYLPHYLISNQNIIKPMLNKHLSFSKLGTSHTNSPCSNLLLGQSNTLVVFKMGSQLRRAILEERSHAKQVSLTRPSIQQ